MVLVVSGDEYLWWREDTLFLSITIKRPIE